VAGEIVARPAVRRGLAQTLRVCVFLIIAPLARPDIAGRHPAGLPVLRCAAFVRQMPQTSRTEVCATRSRIVGHVLDFKSERESQISDFKSEMDMEGTPMKYERFEQLPVWNAAIDLAVSIHTLTGKPAFHRRFSLRDQLERAAVSVGNNIAEGFERGTTQELLTFLYIARGSAGEVRSMLCLLERLPGFADLKSEISNLKSPAEGVSRQLRAWADSLQNSEIKGQRYLTDKSRRAAESRRDRDHFLEKLKETARHPTRKGSDNSK
jgi:four helix bundle protein